VVDRLNVALSVDALGPRLTGIGRYCLELARGIPAEPRVDEVRYFRGAHWLDDPEALLAEGWAPSRRGRLRSWLEQGRNRRHMRTSIVHGPNYFLPDWADQGIITVHDLSVLLYPETHPAERIRDFERRFQSSLDRASAIITDSEAVRGEVISMLGIAGEKVTAIPLGVSGAASHADPLLLRQLDLAAGGYSLCVSTFEPRKRIDALVTAYRLLNPALRRSVPLVLAGASGWQNDALNSLIEAGVAEGWIRRLDFVSDEVLATLYAGAQLFIYPSRYEGFGLPPIEAMRNGVPTIVGNADTLIEITRGAVRVVDADDIDAFSEMLAASLDDHEWRVTAAAAGRAVAQIYQWPECVRKTVNLYSCVGIRQ
jgi:glycosyltransferase involved in cell wall biosynthesis